MLDHLSHVFHTLPIFALVGFGPRYVAPLAIEDAIRIMEAALVEGKLSRQTISVLGPERMTLEDAVRRVGKVVGKVPVILPMPAYFHYALAKVLEATMTIPLVSVAQVRMLAEGFEEPYGLCQSLPEDLKPVTRFSEDQIRKGLPAPAPFGLDDLRCRSASG